MAGRILNRRDLRRMADAAEQRGVGSEAAGSRGDSPKRAGEGGAGRVCARWGVYDGAMKLVETFDYKDRALADQKAAELTEVRHNGTTYFVQLVKEGVAGRGNLD
jgi:hypothetical protein